MHVSDPNNVGIAKQTDPALLHCALAIKEQKKVWSVSNFVQTPNNT